MPTLSLELEAGHGTTGIVCGIDEVGRGPLAGPVVAAAAVLPHRGLPAGLAREIQDSKVLSRPQRLALAPLILEHGWVALGSADVAEIDALNILNAALLAMARAVEALGFVPDFALVDGNRPPRLPCPARTVVRGDSQCLSIAAASIVAKVHRDGLMQNLAETHPYYGWERNAGYGTREHLVALETFGPTEHHRRSFAPVSKLNSIRV